MAKFEMDTDFIRKLAAILEETDLGEIELADGDRRIRVARPTVNVTQQAAPLAAAAPAAPVAAAPGAPAAAAAGDLSKHPGVVKSPTSGTVASFGAYFGPVSLYPEPLAATGIRPRSTTANAP